MMKNIKTTLIFIFILLIGSTANAGFPPHPQFELFSIDGGRYTSRELRGKAVLIQFFSRVCQPCRLEVPFINKLHNKFPDTLQVLGIGWYEADYGRAVELIKNWGMQYPVCPDPDGRVVGAFLGQRVVLPNSVLIDHRGRFVKNFAGLHESINRELEKRITDMKGPIMEYRKRGPAFYVDKFVEKDGASGLGKQWRGKIKSWLTAKKIPVSNSLHDSDYVIEGVIGKNGAEVEIEITVKSRAGAVETTFKKTVPAGNEKDVQAMLLKQLEIFPYLAGKK